jgi:hypothetical protein
MACGLAAAKAVLKGLPVQARRQRRSPRSASTPPDRCRGMAPMPPITLLVVESNGNRRRCSVRAGRRVSRSRGTPNPRRHLMIRRAPDTFSTYATRLTFHDRIARAYRDSHLVVCEKCSAADEPPLSSQFGRVARAPLSLSYMSYCNLQCCYAEHSLLFARTERPSRGGYLIVPVSLVQQIVEL